MPYYVKKRIIDILISVVMLMFLALTILPVGWMVFFLPEKLDRYRDRAGRPLAQRPGAGRGALEQ